MLGRVEWKEGSKVDCFNEAGDCIEIDWDDGPTPVQITLQMIGACSLADIQTGLKGEEDREDLDRVSCREKRHSAQDIY